MTQPATTFSRPSHLDREMRTIRIEALQAISFASQIERDWDEIAREAVEGSHQRHGANRFKGE